ncbi:roquin-1 [Athalia rosae]|uniref:roquin-1 n=1 Tax=Athalia rosae TaxID=37344 RepID=UPI00203477DB|nr:roquin-1 [Athalia rosae]
MPIQAPQWTEFLSCPVCRHDFDATQRGPISLGCGHTVCRTCLANLQRKQCPFDQSVINTEVERLPLNDALLQLVGSPVTPNSGKAHSELVPIEDHAHYLAAKCCIEELALYLKPCQTTPATGMGLVSRPMQRKLVTLVGCQLVEPEGRARAVRAARSLGERSVTELILQHQNPQQLSANLWAAVRARGCQFLGPAMQEEVLKLVLLALEDGSALSRKVLVMFVVQRLEPHFPQASKTSIGHVVQLLYRASCFKVSKREGDSSLMQLKEEFRTYEALRREHDAQIVQIATEAGLRIAPDQWSALLYGDTGHKSHMQSIIDKLQTPQSFAQSVQELVIALQRTTDPGQLSSLRPQLELLASIDPSPETEAPTWTECRGALEAVRTVVAALVEFIQQHGNRKPQDSTHNAGPGQPKYKVSMCRDLALRGSCPRATSCTFAHSGPELDKYRSKHRKLSVRSSLSLTGNSEVKVGKSAALSNNKGLKQCDDLVYHSGMPYDNVLRENFTSGTKVGSSQDSMISNDNNFVGPMPNYISSPTQSLNQVLPSKNVQMQYAHYVMPGPGVEYTSPNSPTWDPPQMTPTVHNNAANNNKKQRSVAKTLAMLLHRKMEIISQLENIVGKQTPVQLKTSNTSQGDQLTSNFSIWTTASGTQVPPPSNINYGTTFHHSDSILLDDEFVPFDTPPASKYGPISRVTKPLVRSPNAVQASTFFGEGTPTIQRRPMPSASPVTSWHYGHQQHAMGGHSGVQPLAGSTFGDGYITVGRGTQETNSQVQLSRQESMSKDLLLESQKVKQQLKHLEEKINELKLATQGAAFSEGERLAQELQMIEAGIREKERDVRNWSPYGMSWFQPSSNLVQNHNLNRDYGADEEDTYEAGIANDMRELELRWEFELEEHEKRWSSEEDNIKK